MKNKVLCDLISLVYTNLFQFDCETSISASVSHTRREI